MDEDIKLVLEFQKSPILFIRKMWGLEPQPLKEEYKNKEIALRDYKPEHFEKFERGEHITWQQWVMLQALTKAVNGEASKRISVMSGHGIGKDACLSWVILWYLFCFKEAQIGCTAPSSEQMYDILWKELAKWLYMMPVEIADLYDWQSTHLRIKERPETWFARAKTARKETPEALAGLHGEHVLLVADEASGIEEIIYRTAEGALTGENFYVVLIGNPLRREGYFYNSHNKDKEAWQRFNFNSEHSPIVEKDFIQRIIKKYGIDSDEYRVRVEGYPPQEGTVDEGGWVSLFRESEIREAQQIAPHFGEERLGVDPADSGPNESVLVKRSSGYAEIMFNSAKADIMDFTGQAIIEVEEVNSREICVDRVGVGAGMLSRLNEVNRQRSGSKKFNVIGVNAGEAATDGDKFANKRAEMYWRIRQWLKQGGKLKPNEGWEQLLSIRYKADSKGRIRIMPKEIMLKRGFPSPDIADALSMTFYKSERNPRYRVDPADREFYNMIKKKRQKERRGSGFKMVG